MWKIEKRQNWLSLVAGRCGLHVAPGIDPRVVHRHFIVNVRTGGAAADAAVTDDLAALDARTGNGRERGKMRVPGSDPEPVVNHYHASIAGVIFCADHYSVGSHMNRRAIICCNVHSGMECG